MLDAAFEDKLKDARARRAATLASRGESVETLAVRPPRSATTAQPSLAAASPARPMMPRSHDGPVELPRPRPRAEAMTARPRAVAPVAPPAPVAQARQMPQPARPTLLPAALFALRRSLAGMATISGPTRVAPLIAAIFAAGIGIGALVASFGPATPPATPAATPAEPAPMQPAPMQSAAVEPAPVAALPESAAPVATPAAPAPELTAEPTAAPVVTPAPPAVAAAPGLTLPAIDPAPPLAAHALSGRPHPRPRTLTDAPATDGGLTRATEAAAAARRAASGTDLAYPDSPALRSALGTASAARGLASVPPALPVPATGPSATPAAGPAPETILEILRTRAAAN